MQVQFIASVSVITPDPPRSRALFIHDFGLPLEAASVDDEYAFTDKLDGCKHFGVWPLSQAAQACFGTPTWPTDRPVPQVSIEFEVGTPEAVDAAARELHLKGHMPLHQPKTEPWGQRIARIQDDAGAIIGISFTPSMHEAH